VSIRRLIAKLAVAEEEARRGRILAPCLPGGMIRVKVSGLALTLRVSPGDFEGWGIFRAADDRVAELEEEPDLPSILRYLERLRPLRAWLCCPLRRRTWLAYPASASDARQRGGQARPFPLHLVSGASAFDRVVARHDGRSWWFGEPDRRSDPRITDQLREAQAEGVAPGELRVPGLTPELRTAYALATRKDEELEGVRAQTSDEQRLRRALEVGGGELHGFVDHGGYWTVEWSTGEGQRHTSAVSRDQLTVLSAGVCLDDRDSDFDLESLVGVMEGSDEYGW
jgi:hypothetical protein